MGYDHPQYEMWSSSKHGTRFSVSQKGKLPEGVSAPTCQYCHLPEGTHKNRVAWGFLAVRLPLPEDKEWAADQTTILKALGVLNPKTGKPTKRLEAVKKYDMARLTHEDWQAERNRLLARCSTCHAGNFAKDHLAKGDAMIRKADRLMAEAIEIVAALYQDNILTKPKHYDFAYPDLLYFKRTGGSYIEQVLLRMFLKHRMRTYQGIFHANPDYAYWYGWAAMTKSLGEIKELDKTLRALPSK
jgi:cytochrome c553